MADDNTFFVDIEGLGRAIPVVHHLAGRIRSIGTQLEATLAEIGECWGKDKNGEQFLSQYQKPRDNIFEALAGIGDVLDSAADGIHTMSKNYERQENDNVLELQRLKANDPENGGGKGGGSGAPRHPMTARIAGQPLRPGVVGSGDAVEGVRPMRAAFRGEPLRPGVVGPVVGERVPAGGAGPEVPGERVEPMRAAFRAEPPRPGVVMPAEPFAQVADGVMPPGTSLPEIVPETPVDLEPQDGTPLIPTVLAQPATVEQAGTPGQGSPSAESSGTPAQSTAPLEPPQVPVTESMAPRMRAVPTEPA